MIDKEKVISTIEEEVRLGELWDKNYRTLDLSLLEDVLALLKQHKPIEPTPYMDGLVQRFACGKCGKHLLYATWGRDNYCSKCGQEVKWDD